MSRPWIAAGIELAIDGVQEIADAHGLERCLRGRYPMTISDRQTGATYDYRQFVRIGRHYLKNIPTEFPGDEWQA